MMWIVALVVVTALVLLARRVTSVLTGAAGFIAHTVSTEVFTSGLALDRVIRESLHGNPTLRALAPVTRIDVDRDQRTVSVSIVGVVRARTIYRDRLGTLLVRGPRPSADADADAADVNGATIVRTQPDPFPAVTGPVIATGSPGLARALDKAFTVEVARRNTRAVVVTQAGSIVAERYAEGIGPDTALPAFSVAKSVTSALIGVLVRRGLLEPDQPAPVEAWQTPGDPRCEITIEQLLRMTSGLATTETNTGLDDVTRILYTTHDMAAAATSARLKHQPGSTYYYSSGNTLILSRIIGDLVGGTATAVHDMAQAELFGQLGMTGTGFEYDAAGTPIGSTYLISTARDLARFGLLYLHDGAPPGGRILPEGWVELSRSQTLDSEYGAGWRPASSKPAADRFGMHDVPADTYFAVGFMGQYIVVIPSHDLVIVRMGASFGDIGHVDAIGELVRDVVAAVERARPHLVTDYCDDE
jgi:CubicO group peptidase (beta-lactamase class C family)